MIINMPIRNHSQAPSPWYIMQHYAILQYVELYDVLGVHIITVCHITLQLHVYLDQIRRAGGVHFIFRDTHTHPQSFASPLAFRRRRAFRIQRRGLLSSAIRTFSNEVLRQRHCSIVQYSVVQYSIVQYSIVQCSVVQCSVVQCSVVQCSVVQCSVVYYIIAYIYVSGDVEGARLRQVGRHVPEEIATQNLGFRIKDLGFRVQVLVDGYLVELCCWKL